MRWLVRKGDLLGGQRGFSLIETLVAVAILAAVGSVFVQSLFTGSMAAAMADEQFTADNLAKAQIESTKNSPYLIAPTTYPTTITLPDGYSVSVEASPIPEADDDIQKISVTVSRGERVVLIMESLKVNR